MLVITRAQEDFKNENTDKYFHLPCIEFTKPSAGYEALDFAIKKNHQYEWLFFLSRKAAEVFFTRLLAIGGHLFLLAPHLKIAVIGEKTAEFIKNQVRFPVNFMPSEASSFAFIEEFSKNFRLGSKALLPRSELAQDDFKSRFEANSSLELDIIPAYNTVCPSWSESKTDEFVKLLETQDRVIISFASSSAVDNFVKLSASINLLQYDNLHFLSIGSKTSACIRKSFVGFDLDSRLFQSEQADFDSMIKSCVNGS